MTGVNVTQSVIVLGDSATRDGSEVLVARAAEDGIAITEYFAFDLGAGAAHSEVADIEAVVEALSRAIVTRTPIWLPYPVEDLAREAHWRRLSVALQRHGLNLLMGRSMTPCPIQGGFSEIDNALRAEVRAVDALDHAALAAAGQRTLSAEIEDALAAGVGSRSRACRGERIYSTQEAAGLLGQPMNWISWGLRQRFFTYTDNTPIEPLRVGRSRRRRFTLSMLEEMAKSCHRKAHHRVPDTDAQREVLRRRAERGEA